MSAFTNRLIVSPLEDGRHWMIMSTGMLAGKSEGENNTTTFDMTVFRYDIGYEGSNTFVQIQPGFITDFASIPRPLWWLLPKWGKYGKAAIIHDWIYREHAVLANTALGHYIRIRCNRKRADDIMMEAMKVLGVKSWQRYLIYAGVRLGGWFPWRRYERR